MWIAPGLEAQPSAPLLPPGNQPDMQLPANLRALSGGINSPYEESEPVISADGNILYFCRQQHPQNFGADKVGDIWMSKRKANGSWTRPVNVGAPLNNPLYNAPMALDPSGEIIYVLDNYGDEEGEGLAWSQREGRSWSNPQACEITDFYTIGDGATFHLAADGNTLVMALERREGQGRRDLYVSFREADNQWSAPLNLGKTINTAKEEARAFLAADGMTLYFASRGHGGFGGFDLFYSHRLDDSWTNWSVPQNLGETINSRYDDEYISLPAQGDPAYLVYRDTSSMNIYTASLPEEFRPDPVKLVRGKINLGDENENGTLQVISMDLRSGQAPRILPLREDGTFSIVVPPGEELGLQVEAPGYFPLSTYLTGNQYELQEDDGNAMLASTEWSPEYQRRDGEIRNLRLRLDQVDEELAELRKQKETYLNTLRANDPNYGTIRYSDPEMDALKHKYEELNRPVVIDTVPPASKKEDWQNKGSQIPEKDRMRGTPDDELADMKQRFNRFYQPGKQQKEKDEFLWEEAKSFADFQEEVEAKMLQEMRPRVGRELTRDLWPQVRASLQGSLDPQSMKILDEKEYEIREQIAQSLEEGTANLEQSPIQMPAWQNELEAEIRTNITPKVQSQLEIELQDEVRQALTNEAFYQIRQQEAEMLNQRLRENIRLQVQEEERQQPLGAATPGGRMRDLQVKGIQPVPAVYEEERRELQLLKAEKGAVFSLNNVFFKPNTDQLKEVSYVELDRVVGFLADHPQVVVEVAAHTNGWLNHTLSLELSEQRARAIYDYLLSRGISGERLQYKGYGKTQPLLSNDTLEGRRKNQRVELHILDN
ncbi:MAG: OmpA family protein [Saprospiraceae bacterium]